MKGSWPEGRSKDGADRSLYSDGNPDLHFMKGLISAFHASLTRVVDDFDADSFDRMIGVLAEAGLIYLVGSKRAFPVTAYLSLTLSQQGIRNVLVDNVGSTAFDQVGCIGQGDAVLAVSFSPYNSITPDLVAVARERRASVVSITDSTFSPLARLSDHWVEVVESDFGGFRSLAASLAVGMALVHGVVARRSASRAVD
jgi:DNA-binding MurR/RpiR family transcriptional regulator